MTSNPSESWASFVPKKKEFGISSVDGTVDSTIRALESISDQVSSPLEPKLSWMSPEASMIIQKELSKESVPCMSMVREASTIVNHFLKKRKVMNRSNGDIPLNGVDDLNHSGNKSEIVPLIEAIDLSSSSVTSLFTNPRLHVSMCELIEPSLATTWLPGLNVSTQYEQMNEQSKQIEPQELSLDKSTKIKWSEDTETITLDDFRDDLYSLMAQTMTEGRLMVSFPRRLQDNRQKLMDYSAREWCVLLPSTSLFQISKAKIESSCEPVRDVLLGLSVFISVLGTLCPSQTCGRHLVSTLLPTAVQIISNLDSTLHSKVHCDYSEICTKISNDIIYKYRLGTEKKSNLLRLLAGLKNSNIDFGSRLWLELSKVYYECNS